MRATIFDCDGTLVDSEGLAQEVMVQCAAEHGLRMTVQQSLQWFRGSHMAEVVKTLERMLGKQLPEDFVPQYRKRMRLAFRDRLQPIAGALEVVRSIEGPMAVASSGPLEKIKLSLSLTGLQSYFGQHLYSCYEIGVWKPDPSIFLHTAQRLNVDPSQCTVVEDSLPGILSGVAAKMRVIAYQPDQVDPKIPPEVIVVKHFSEVGELLKEV